MHEAEAVQKLDSLQQLLGQLQNRPTRRRSLSSPFKVDFLSLSLSLSSSLFLISLIYIYIYIYICVSIFI